LQAKFSDDRGPATQQFVRQTDGTGDVVSGDAELDQQVMSGLEHPGTSSSLVEPVWKGSDGVATVM
jgi:hypothetical protein